MKIWWLRLAIVFAVFAPLAHALEVVDDRGLTVTLPRPPLHPTACIF